MSKGKIPAITPQLQAAIDRSRQHDTGKFRLQQCIAELDRLHAQQTQVVQEAAKALALIEGHSIVITQLEADPQTGMLGAITYQGEGGQKTLTINRKQTGILVKQ